MGPCPAVAELLLVSLVSVALQPGVALRARSLLTNATDEVQVNGSARLGTGETFESANESECGSALNVEETYEWKEFEGEVYEVVQFNALEGRRPPQLIEERIQFNGKPWCEGRHHGLIPLGIARNKVALVLTGASFRTRDFFNRLKVSCTEASVSLQGVLAKNHYQQVIAPLEAMQMHVDIFLDVVPCGVGSGSRMWSFPPDNKGEEALFKNEETKPDKTAEFNHEETLRNLYGPGRVKAAFRSSLETNMYSRMADTFVQIDAAQARSGSYAYYIFLRYDVYLDDPLVSPQHSEPHMAHKTLSSFKSAHDFMFAFPGEMWNCMLQFWDQCMRITSNHGDAEIKYDKRRELGCFDIGPLQLHEWAQGYAYDAPLRFIGMALNRADPRHSLWTPWRKRGTSAFDREGREFRCRSAWFWPPKSTWQHELQPYYYHIGL